MAADIETQQLIIKIRKLVKTHGIRGTARLVNRSPCNVQYISEGKRHAKTGQIILNDLQLRRGSGKLCRLCGEHAIIVAGRSNLCIICEILELVKSGVLEFVGEQQEEALLEG